MKKYCNARSLLLAAVVYVASCHQKSLSPLYCEGGVTYKGEGMGGECLFLTMEAVSGDPNSVGTAHWRSGNVADRYSVRRTSKNKYELFLNGAVAGTLEQDDNWVKVKLSRDSTKTYSLRDDPPGALN